MTGNPSTYPILTRWPAAEDMPDGSVWRWTSPDYDDGYQIFVAWGGWMTRVPLAENNIGWPFSELVADWGDGDTLQRIR